MHPFSYRVNNIYDMELIHAFNNPIHANQLFSTVEISTYKTA